MKTILDTVTVYLWWLWLEISTRVQSLQRRNEPANRGVLLIAWSLPPSVSSGVFRPTSWLRYGPELGWKITALGGHIDEANDKLDRSLLDGLPAGTEIDRVERLTLRPSWSLTPRINGSFIEALMMASRVLKKRDLEAPRIVVATGPPFHVFLAARLIARAFKAKLVLDYRDEWTESPFPTFPRERLDPLFEKVCLRAADAVIFVTESSLRQQLGAFEFLSHKACSVVPNGWESSEFNAEPQGESSESVSVEQPLLLSYVGHLGTPTPPDSFLDCLARVLTRRPDLRDATLVRFVGNRVESTEATLRSFAMPDSLDMRERVSKPEAIRLMRASGALLILSEPELARSRPGKIYDYLAAGRPVLVYGSAGETSRIVEELKAGLFVPDQDDQKLEEALDRLSQGDPNDWSGIERQRWLERHTRREMAKSFFDALDHLTG